MSICLPKPFAEELKNAIEAGRVVIDDLATKSTAERRQTLERLFQDAVKKNQQSFPDASIPNKNDIDALITQFNKGFEDRIITSSRDIQAKIARQREIIAANKTPASVKRAENIIADLTGTQEQLLARQKKLLKDYVTRETSGIPKRIKKTTIEKIDSLKFALNPDEQKLFLEDMVSQRLGFVVSDDTKKTLSTLAENASVSRAKAQEALETIETKVTESFKKKNASRYDEVNKITDKTIRDAELRKLDIEAKHFADDVYLGKVSAEGAELTKADFKALEKARIENMMSNQQLVDFVSAQEQLLTEVKWADIKDAPDFHRKVETLITKIVGTTLDAGGTLKSVIGSLDLSFIFRQGWVIALNNPKLYGKAIAKTLAESWQVLRDYRKIGDELTGDLSQEFLFREMNNRMMADLNAEIMSRPNAMRGVYARARNNFGLNAGREETFPSSLPSRVPIVGRLFNASDYFFNALAQRSRADLADVLIKKAELEGVDIMDREIMSELGDMVSAFTGRGKPFGNEIFEGKISNALNQMFFSPRFVGSRIYTAKRIVTSPFKLTKKNATFAEKTAAKYAATAALETLGALAVLHFTARQFWGEQSGVDANVGSTGFGSIRVGDYAFDLTGGHASYIALLGRMLNASQGVKYNSRLGIYEDAGFGQTTVDVLIDFVLNKTSPAGSVAKDILNQHQFGGDELDTKYFLKSIFLPITVENVVTAADSSYADAMLIWIADSIGVSSRDMRLQPMTKEWKALKEADPEAYKRAMDKLNEVVWDEIDAIRSDPDFDEMTKEEQDKYIDKVVSRIERDVASTYTP